MENMIGYMMENKMTSKELRKYYYLSTEIKEIKNKLQEIAQQSIKVNELTGMPHGTGVSDPVAKKVELLDKYSRKLEAKEIEAIEEMLKIEKYIESIDDIIARIIFSKRYIEFKTWNRIAIEMKMSKRHIQRIHHKYLEEEKTNED